MAQRLFLELGGCTVDRDNYVDAEGELCSDEDMKKDCTQFTLREAEDEVNIDKGRELSNWEKTGIIQECTSSQMYTNIVPTYRDKVEKGDISRIASDFIDFLGLSWDSGMERALKDFEKGMGSV